VRLEGLKIQDIAESFFLSNSLIQRGRLTDESLGKNEKKTRRNKVMKEGTEK
jgi:hypothetical protein